MLRSEPAPADLDARVFGELARTLEARAVPDGADPARVRVLFRPTGADLAPLLELPGARLEPGSGRELARLEVPRAPLAALSRDHQEATCLLAAHELALAPPPPPRLMGVLNVTPDSFSDGGRHLTLEDAVEQGLKLVRDGVEILDVGGESTRPGAAPVPVAEELERVVPVIEELARTTTARLSIDTTKSEVARAALDAGAHIVNDVSAGRHDPHMLDLIAERGAGAILMHMRGSARDMQDGPAYDDVVREVVAHLRQRVAAGLKAGIDASRIAIDPGIGFGKRLKDNLDLIRALPQMRSLGLPIVLGVSRKSFLGRISGEREPKRRSAETLAATAVGCMLGADIHRVHEAAEARACLLVVGALRGAGVH